jgi:L-threonylcarbamoyladenylate synthase
LPKIYKNLEDAELISMIKSGAVGVLPTDTIYGLVASAQDKVAAEKVLKVKGRKNKPGTMIASSIKHLEELGIKHRYLKAVEQFWPGAVSVILPVPSSLDYLHSGLLTLPVRVTNNKKLSKLLESTGPIITTSANLPEQKPAETIDEAKKYFGNNVDFYVDGGHVSSGPPSTIIRIIDDAIEIIREGSVKIGEDGRIKNDV